MADKSRRIPVTRQDDPSPEKKLRVQRGKPVGEKPPRPAEESGYVCLTCGKKTKTRPHQCSAAQQLSGDYVCSYCGKSAGDPYHVCSPMLAEVKYRCGACGRVTPHRGGVCRPRTIR